MRIPTVLAAENHWMIPHDENEVYWASLAFFIVVGLMWKLAGPAVKKAWDARIERITAEVGDAEGERERILAEARAAAETLERQLVERAHEEAAEAKARAAEDISSAQRQALGLVLATVRAGLDVDVVDHLDDLLTAKPPPRSDR